MVHPRRGRGRRLGFERRSPRQRLDRRRQWPDLAAQQLGISEKVFFQLRDLAQGVRE